MPKAGRGSEQVMVRLPDGMRDRLKNEAEINGRSMNAEIVQRLQATIADDDVSRARPRGDYNVVIQLPGDCRDRIWATAVENERTFNSEIVFTLEREYPDLAPINDIIYNLNAALDRARTYRTKRELYELEMAIVRIDEFYRHHLVNEEIKPIDEGYEVHPLRVTKD